MRGVVRVMLMSMLATSAAASESPEVRQERGEWRVSVGASVIGGVRPRLGANRSALTSLSGFGTAIGRLGGGAGGGRSKGDAYAAGVRVVDVGDGDGRFRLPRER